jgi:U3 small nucleolar ribonucleoprotein component
MRFVTGCAHHALLLAALLTHMMWCPVVLQVRSDVAALALEEVAPLAVSTAALAAPSEVFTAAAPGGEGKAEQELSR